MLLDVASLLEAQESTVRIPFCEEIEFPSDIGVLETPVEGDIVIERSDDGKLLTIRGNVKTRLQADCDRCGNPYPLDLDVPVDEILRVEETSSAALELEETVEPSGKLDLTDLLRQTLILDLPLRKLCGCPALQEGEAPRIDLRWRSLEALKQRSTEEEK